MSDAPLLSPDEDADLLAAEYVLGTLDLAERAGAEARARVDAGFAARITAWENRLADLNDDYDPVPAPDLLVKIEARLFPRAAKRGWFSGFAGFGMATLAALALVAFLILQPTPPGMTATLVADAGPLRYEAVIAGDEMTLTQVAGTAAEAGRDYELWIIAGQNAPVSLGVVKGNVITMKAPTAEAGTVLAITLEPAGGSPTGGPTGPVVAAGALTLL